MQTIISPCFFLFVFCFLALVLQKMTRLKIAHIDKPHHVFIAKAKACQQATCSKHIIRITKTLTNCSGHDVHS